MVYEGLEIDRDFEIKQLPAEWRCMDHECDYSQLETMTGENRQLVTNEPIEFEK